MARAAYSPVGSAPSDSFLPTWTLKESPPKGRSADGTESTISGYLTKPTLQRTVNSLFLFALPSFISSRLSNNPTIYKVTSTSWLDGLRGIACVIVFSFHFFFATFENLLSPWDHVKNNYFMELPVIRILHSGRAMVSIFFIISGFALSFKSARQMKEPASPENSHNLLRNLASSAFRRYLRLVLPCLGSFMLVCLFVAAGWLEAVPYGRERLTWLRGVVDPRPPMEASFHEQIVCGMHEFYQFAVRIVLFSDQEGYRWETNAHVWTIPIEFRQSLYLFLMILSLSQIKRWIRVYLVLPLSILFSFHGGGWEFALFMIGFLLAEIHIESKEETKIETEYALSTDATRTKPNQGFCGPSWGSVARGIVLLIALYFASYPHENPKPGTTTGYTWLTEWTPQNSIYLGEPSRFWFSVGAAMTVTCLNFMPSVKRLLCSRVCQYLGRISFSLYLVQRATISSVGYSLIFAGWERVGVGRLLNSTAGDMSDHEAQTIENWRVITAFAAFAITFLVTIWVADIFWRLVDIPSVKFVRWLEKWLLDNPESTNVPNNELVYHVHNT